MKTRSMAYLATVTMVLAGCSFFTTETGTPDTAEETNEAMSSSSDAMLQPGSAAMEKEDTMMESSSSSTMMQSSDAAMMETKGIYAAYTDGVIGNGKYSVLFFHAAWCPYCKAHDATLTSWYLAQSFRVSTYRVDYDTSSALKQQYGVVQQDTFILIDGKGNKIAEATGYPSDADIMALIKKNS